MNKNAFGLTITGIIFIAIVSTDVTWSNRTCHLGLPTTQEKTTNTHTQPRSPNEEKHGQIKEFINEWVTMWNTYNIKSVKKLFLNSDALTYFSSEKEGLIKGFKNVISHHSAFGFIDGGKKSPNRLWLDKLTISKFGATTIISSLWYFKRPNGVVQKGPVSFVALEQPDGYKFVHLHFGNYK